MQEISESNWKKMLINTRLFIPELPDDNFLIEDSNGSTSFVYVGGQLVAKIPSDIKRGSVPPDDISKSVLNAIQNYRTNGIQPDGIRVQEFPSGRYGLSFVRNNGYSQLFLKIEIPDYESCLSLL